MTLNPFRRLREWLQPRFNALHDHINLVNDLLQKRLTEISEQIGKLTPKRTVRLAVVGFNIKPKERNRDMLQTQLRTSQYAEVSFKPLDADGKEVGIDGELQTTVVEGSPEIRRSGLTLLIIPPDTQGRIEVKVDADAAPGEDVEIISETVVLDVLPNNAVTLGGSINVKSKSELPPAS